MLISRSSKRSITFPKKSTNLRFTKKHSINENYIFIPAPIEDAENVDIRGVAIGIIPLLEYIQIISNQ